jgi:hypothetical protein
MQRKRTTSHVTRRPLRLALILPTIAVAAALLFALTPGADARACAPPHGFVWGKARTPDGDRCWDRNEGAAFTRWLRTHGASAIEFRERHPELARIFAQPWPARKPPLRDCHSSSCARAVIRAVFPDHVEDYAIAIAYCESRLYPRAVGDGGESIGLFQVNIVWWKLPWVGGRDALFSAWHNSKVALRISGGGTNWQPWTCARYV